MTTVDELKINAVATCYAEWREFGYSPNEADSKVRRTVMDVDSRQMALGIERGERWESESDIECCIDCGSTNILEQTCQECYARDCED